MEVSIGVLIIALLLSVAGVLERRAHRRNLSRIPLRVHVNGTRGKSSVTRLVAAALREHGVVTCAKTTGTTARMILADGREIPIFRPAGANVIEQKRIVARAVDEGAQALVVECMALQPELQALCELELIRATHAVITNVRPDHLDVMGPSEEDVARALCGVIPVGGKVFTAEAARLGVIRDAAADRGAELHVVDAAAIERVSDDELRAFSYVEHRDNVALALEVCASLGVPREVALRGMARCAPDPGALTTHHVLFFGRKLVFMNAFAANDPVSTRQLWERAWRGSADLGKRIAVFNCREDRPDRSLQFARELARWSPADHVVLMGSGTFTFARAAIRSGLAPSKLVLAEQLPVHEVFERIVGLVGRSALIMGIGNIGGSGLALVRFFANRASSDEASA